MVMKMKYSLLALTAIIAVISVSCNFTQKYEKEEEDKIQAYLNQHSSQNFEKKSSGLYYLEVTTGSGIQPETHDTVYAFYTGKYLDGTAFDSNVGKTDTLIFPLKEGWVIEGLEEGISYMKVGGSSVLLIPSYLGFGNYDYRMPAYTPTIFEITLAKVKVSSAKKK